MKKILGLSTLVLVGMLTFNGCNSGKDNGAIKLIEYFEKIEIGVEYDTYKITYEDGTTDTIKVKKGDLIGITTEEETKNKYKEAYVNTLKSKVVSYSFSFTDTDNSSSTIEFSNHTMNENGYHVETCEGSFREYSHYMYNKDKTAVIEYSKSITGYKNSDYYDKSNNISEIFWDEAYFLLYASIDQNILHLFRDNDNLQIDYELVNGKYKVTIVSPSNDFEGEELPPDVLTYVFSDKIESVSLKRVYNSFSERTWEYKFAYHFNDVIAETDFSSYPIPEEE